MRRLNLDFFEFFLEPIDDFLANLLGELSKNSNLKLFSQQLDLLDLDGVSRSLNHILAAVQILEGDRHWANSFVYIKWYPN